MMKSPYTRNAPKKQYLILIFLMVTLFICSPAVVGEQMIPNVYTSLQNQTPSVKLLADESEQTSPLKTADGSTTADYSFNVGTHITITAWEASSTPPPSGVTMVFQRSEDGVTWCTYHTGVTGADGYAYADRTETCPGIVYYRAANEHGLGSANVISIEWLQTNPPMTCVPVPRCIDKSYSMTMIQKPGLPIIGVGNLTPWGTMVHNVVQRELVYDDWTNIFYHTEESVTKADFAVTDNGNLNLNDATLHYHMGHGHEDWLLETHHSWIPLTGWPFGADTLVDHTDVYKKWTDKNKWVILDSCDVLIDKQWGGALKTSHGILGYSSYKWTSDTLPRLFFDNAITNNRPITQSYYIATKEAQTGPLATVIFDDPYQLYWDHLPGHGDIVTDEDPDDDIVYYTEWSSGSGGSGAGARQQGSIVRSTVIQSAIGEVALNTTLPASPVEIPILAATVNPGDIIRNWSEDLMDEQHNVTTEADAPQVALNILQTEGGGLPQGAILSYVNTTFLYAYNTETEEYVNSSPLLTSVQYRREIDGMPVGGRGGVIDITLGEAGKNLGLLKVWRTASEVGSQKIIPADVAVEKLIAGDFSEIPREGMNITINDIKLGYFEKGADEQQEFFEPVWFFYGVLDSGESIDLYVYARKFANFTASPTVASTGDLIRFTDTSEASPTRWLWDFGDGTNSTLQHPTHAYAAGGNYTVNLTAWNDLGSDKRTVENYIRIYPDPKPAAGFTSNYSYSNVIPPLTIAFNDTSVGYITNRSWDFGDGNISFEKNPVYTFSLLPQTVYRYFLLNHTVIDQFGRSASKQEYIFIYKGYDPYFTAEPSVGPNLLNVTFTDFTEDPEQALGRYWEFGDSQTQFDWEQPFAESVYHEYLSEGNYSVSLTYYGPMEDGFTTTKEFHIPVQDIVPLVDFSANTTVGKAQLAVEFSDLSTRLPTAWSWDFGDGTGSDVQDPIHTYSLAGTYTISLTATNSAGSNSTVKIDYIVVLPLYPPQADFSANITAGNVPLTVLFSDNSSWSPTSWNWSFGDGTTSDEQNPVHVYQALGTYTVSLTASNTDGSNTMIKPDYITVSSLAPPVAAFTGTPTCGKAPLAVTFTDSSTGSPTAWDWDFGDGTTSSQQNMVHTYTAAGKYTVSLTASNDGGSNTSTRLDYITVSGSGKPPVAKFTGKPTSGYAPLSVTFTDSSTNSPAGWSWDFGDTTNSTEQNPVHEYTTPGKYTVSLTATNAGGSSTKTRENYITVKGISPPKANFKATPTSGYSPLTVSFTDTSTGSPTSWSWDFGDGGNSSDQNPVHEYAAAGKYSVSLTASNDGGSTTKTRTNYITVKAVTPTPTPVPPRPVPVVNATADGCNVRMDWGVITDSRLQGYKVVISKNNPNPKYPDDGYMFWITDRYHNYAVISATDHYNSGDFGGYLQPGQNYYFSITAVYSDAKVAGNAVELEFPSCSTPTPTCITSTPTCITSTPTPTPTCTQNPCEPYTIPQLNGTAENGQIWLDWDVITNPCLQGYKVVISKNNPDPKYPEDGYMFWITNRNTHTSIITTTDHYNGGDFGGYLLPGQSYYFSITAVYPDDKVPGNVVRLTYPEPAQALAALPALSPELTLTPADTTMPQDNESEG